MSSKIVRLKDLPDVLDVDQMCEVLNVGKRTGYQLLKENKIQFIKVGRSYRIPKVHLLVYLGLKSVNSSDHYSSEEV